MSNKMTPTRKIYLELSFNMDVWEDYTDELMVEDAFENNSIKSGAQLRIVNLKGINPEAVGDLLEALKFVRDAPQFKRMDWKLKVTIDAAIEKAKL